MTDTSTETEHQESATTSEQKSAEKTFTQAEVDQILGQRLARVKEQYGDYENLQAAAAELQKIKEANKSESQKLADQLTTLQQQLAEREKEVAKLSEGKLRAEVAATKKVPPHRINGTTKEELEADADRYLAELAEQTGASKPAVYKAPATGLKSGASSSGDTPANLQERAAAAVREIRRSGA
jgi:chromosome segregation ATPase